MQLTYLYFTDITPDHEAYQALMARMRAQLQQRKDNPEAQLADSISIAHYGHHPLALPLSEAQLNAIDYSQLLQLYHQYVARPDQYTFIFVGDFDVDTMTTLAQRYIASLPVDNTIRPFKASHPMRLLQGVRDITVQAASVERAQVNVTQSGLLENSMTNEVMMQFYGHVAEIALNAVLREERQLTYGVNASAQLLRTEPRWMLLYQFACKPQDTQQAIDAAINALALIQDRGISEQLFDKVKQMMLRRHDEDIATNAYWMNVLRNRAMNHDIHTSVRETLQSLTLDQFDAFIFGLKYDTDITVLSK